MTKRIYFIPLILFLVASGFFAAKFFYFQKKESNKFSTQILSVDLALKKNAYREALLKLKHIDTARLDLTEFKRYLKRVFQVSKNTENYSLFRVKAFNAVKQYPQDRELQVLYLFSLIKTESYKDARAYSNKSTKNEALDTLKWELFLLDTDNTDLKSTGSGSPFLSLNSNDSAVYEQAAAETDNIGFLYDEALLYLGEGLSGKAYAILKKLPEKYKERTVLLFYSAYQENKYTEALTILNTYDLGFSIKTILLYKSDLMMHLKRYEQAETAYIDFIHLYPEGSWIPYANLAWIAALKSDTKQLPAILKGLEYFPHNPDLLYSIVAYLESVKDTKNALSIIKKYGNKDPVLDAVMLRLQGNLEPDLYIARLQEIVLAENVSDQIKKYYCTFLVKTGHMGTLQNYITALEKQGQSSHWLLFFKALVEVNKGSLDTASDLFTKLYPAQRDWTVVFDAALTQYYNNNYKKALELFQSAESEVSTNSTRSEIRTFTALSLEKLGNSKRAVKELHYALELDNKNNRAYLELNKLQEQKD